MTGLLHEFLTRSAALAPDAIAVEDTEGFRLTYRELDDLTDRVRDFLLEAGITRGDRVGFCLPKSTDAVGLIYGILKAGAAYVPIDPHAPAVRSAYIVRDSDVQLLFVDPERETKLVPALAESGPLPNVVVLATTGGGRGLEAVLGECSPTGVSAPAVGTLSEDDVAYIIYTSGSTGMPKGATLTHGNGVSYLGWASEVFAVTGEDRISLQFPLHFDPSVSDLFLPIKHGACIVVIDHGILRDPVTLGRVIAERHVTVWTSVPSTLALVAEHGRIDSQDTSALRLLMFGGEVFPPVHLRRLRELFPETRILNLYGPTESNVCTHFEIPLEIPEDRTEPYPIGRPCNYLRSRVIGTDGRVVDPGSNGELCVSGPNVMQGYWNLPERTRDVFFEADGFRWYRTGDIVREEDGELVFVGRRDRMVKRRGYRIELGEIEAALHNYPGFAEVAVVASSRDEGTRIHAAYSTGDGRPISVIALKAYCVEALPAYMVPDRFVHVASLPRTSTGKTDYLRITDLTGLAVSPNPERASS
jgi:amino acid adenylation domain-containing protein